MRVERIFLSTSLIVCVTAFSMEKSIESMFKKDDKACFKAIDDFKARLKSEYDSYRYNNYADAVKDAVTFGQDMNKVHLICKLAKIRAGVPIFPLFIVMAKESRCRILLEIMLQRGADPNMCYAAHQKVARPLSEAIIYNALDNAELLLQGGAKPAVEFKLRSDDPDKDPRLSLLLKYGAKPDDIWGGPLSGIKGLDPLTNFKNLSLS
jgi:hypothetical protein